MEKEEIQNLEEQKEDLEKENGPGKEFPNTARAVEVGECKTFTFSEFKIVMEEIW